MKSILSEEVTILIDQATPLITFFGLSAKQQIEILPMLKEEKKYDFPDGDLITKNALKVLTASYYTYLNSLEMTLLITLAEFNTKKIQELAVLLDEGLTSITEIMDQEIENFENLEFDEWNILRQISQDIAKNIQIATEINTEVLKNLIDFRLHP